MEVPQAVIAQAEAAASSNQPENGPNLSPAAGQTPGALGSKKSPSHSPASGQKYAYLTSFLLHRPSHTVC